MAVEVKVLGYMRVSTQEQKRAGVSMEVQKDLLASYCHLRGLTLVDVIEDPGVSAGKPLGSRPGGKILLDRIERQEASAVVTMKLDRLFRNALDCLHTVQVWDEHDIALHLVSQGGTSLDTQSAVGRFLLIIMAGVAEMERNLTRERVQEVIDHKQEKGERTGTVPFGYRSVLGGKKLEPDPQEQQVLAYMQGLRRELLPYDRIVERLNQQGIPSRGARWHKTTVIRLLARMEQADWRPNLREGEATRAGPTISEKSS